MKDTRQKISALEKKFESLMSAISFAEAGAFDEARELLEPSRSVILAANENTLSPKVFNYAASISKRMNASLKLLFVSEKKNPWEALEICLKGIAGLYNIRGAKIREGEPLKARVSSLTEDDLSIEVRQGCIRNQIVDYTNEHTGVLFVVLESADGIAANCARGGSAIEDAWKSLSCPLVYVSELEAT